MSNTTTSTTAQFETLQSLINAEKSYLDSLQLIDSVYMDLHCRVSLSNIWPRNYLHSGWSNCNLLRLISASCSSAFKTFLQPISPFMMYSVHVAIGRCDFSLIWLPSHAEADINRTRVHRMRSWRHFAAAGTVALAMRTCAHALNRQNRSLL